MTAEVNGRPNNDAGALEIFATAEIAAVAQVVTDGHAGYRATSLGTRAHERKVREADALQDGVAAEALATRHACGRREAQAPEEIARARGCVGIRLDTASFQAPAFYSRHGYTEFGRIDGYPPDHTRI